MLIAFDIVGKLMTVVEQQRGSRRVAADMKARHGAEEIGSRDALHRRVDRCQRVDQADSDIVPVDIKAFGCILAVRPSDDGGSLAGRIKQAWRKGGGIASVGLRLHRSQPWPG